MGITTQQLVDETELEIIVGILQSIWLGLGSNTAYHNAKAWLEELRYYDRTGEWNSAVNNYHRDRIYTLWRSHTNKLEYETCPMCTTPSVGPCLTHRS